LSKSKILTEYFPSLAKLPALKEELAEFCLLQTAPAGTVFWEEGSYMKMGMKYCFTIYNLEKVV